jgi:hypothetical protein
MFESSMRRHARNQSLLTAAAVGVVAVALFLSPTRVQRTLRSAVLDVVTPGQAWVLGRYESGRDLALARYSRLISGARRDGVSTAAPETDSRLTALEQACRHLRLENARLREELSLAEKYGVSPVPVPVQS